ERLVDGDPGAGAAGVAAAVAADEEEQAGDPLALSAPGQEARRWAQPHEARAILSGLCEEDGGRRLAAPLRAPHELHAAVEGVDRGAQLVRQRGLRHVPPPPACMLDEQPAACE